MSKPFPWGTPRYSAANAALSELAAELIRQMRSGEYQAPSRLLLQPLTETQQRNADARFDRDRERDEQGLAAGEKL